MPYIDNWYMDIIIPIALNVKWWILLYLQNIDKWGKCYISVIERNGTYG